MLPKHRLTPPDLMSEILSSNADRRKKTLPRYRDSVRTPLFLAGSFELCACTTS
jgi:hypothetical protein